MPTPIDPKRLPTLRAALKRYGEGEMIAQVDLAKLYGVTNSRFTTLAKHRFEDFPPAERHHDKTHWYEGRGAVQAMIRYLEGTGAKKIESARKAAAVMGDATAEVAAAVKDEPQPPTPADMDKLASAQTRVFRLEQEKGQFVRADVARGTIRKLFTTVQRSVTSLASEVDPNGELPPLHRARLESAIGAAMVRIHGSVADWLEADVANV